MGGTDQPHDVLGVGEDLGHTLHDGVDAHIARNDGGREGAAADVVVLAVDALQVAVGEEEVDDGVERRLFAAVQTYGAHFGGRGGTAEPRSAALTVDAAGSGAE